MSGLDRSCTGQEGACMRIVRRFAPPPKEDAVRIQATSGEEAAQELLRGLEWARCFEEVSGMEERQDVWIWLAPGDVPPRDWN